MDGFIDNAYEVIQGNGVYTLTQIDEKYTDENGGKLPSKR